MKLIIDIPEGTYKAIEVGTINQVLEYKVWNAIRNGIPLNDVKAKIVAKHLRIVAKNDFDNGRTYGYEECLSILDNIGKAEHNDGLICTECECKDECDGIEYISKDQCEKKRGWQ